MKIPHHQVGRTDRIQPPPGELTPAQRMLNDAADAGCTFICYYDYGDEDEDYAGNDPVEAWAACTACDLMHVQVTPPNDAKPVAALVIPGNGDDDLADFHSTGWINDWWEAHRDEIIA